MINKICDENYDGELRQICLRMLARVQNYLMNNINVISVGAYSIYV
jgi:hypothetical protein